MSTLIRPPFSRISFRAWEVSFHLWADVVAGDDQHLHRHSVAAIGPALSRWRLRAGRAAATGVEGSGQDSSSAIGPKTGTAISIPSTRLQYRIHPIAVPEGRLRRKRAGELQHHRVSGPADAASKIKGISLPSSLRIENPAMCRSGFRPIRRWSHPGSDRHGLLHHPLPCHRARPCRPLTHMGRSAARFRASHVDPFELDDQGVVGPLVTRSNVGVVAPT